MVRPIYPACNNVFHWFCGALANLSWGFLSQPTIFQPFSATYHNNAGPPELSHLSGRDKVPLPFIGAPCSWLYGRVRRPPEEVKWREAGGGGEVFRSPALPPIHHRDICKWVQGVAETCRQQGHCVCAWPAMSASIVQDPEFVRCVVIVHIFVISGLVFFCLFFFNFLHICQKVSWAGDSAPEHLVVSAWLGFD